MELVPDMLRTPDRCFANPYSEAFSNVRELKLVGGVGVQLPNCGVMVMLAFTRRPVALILDAGLFLLLSQFASGILFWR